jgi:hypothetical protein
MKMNLNLSEYDAGDVTTLLGYPLRKTNKQRNAKKKYNINAL